MNKLVSLLLALAAVALLTAAGIVLSYERYGLAALAAIASIGVMGAGFVMKARARRAREKK